MESDLLSGDSVAGTCSHFCKTFSVSLVAVEEVRIVPLPLMVLLDDPLWEPVDAVYKKCVPL